MRAKYHLASYLYDDFFKYHLSPKLGDFLVEERRREAVRQVRRQAKTVMIGNSIRNENIQGDNSF